MCSSDPWGSNCLEDPYVTNKTTYSDADDPYGDGDDGGGGASIGGLLLARESWDGRRRDRQSEDRGLGCICG